MTRFCVTIVDGHGKMAYAEEPHDARTDVFMIPREEDNRVFLSGSFDSEYVYSPQSPAPQFKLPIQLADLELNDVSGWRPGPVPCAHCGELVRLSPKHSIKHKKQCQKATSAALGAQAKFNLCSQTPTERVRRYSLPVRVRPFNGSNVTRSHASQASGATSPPRNRRWSWSASRNDFQQAWVTVSAPR